SSLSDRLAIPHQSDGQASSARNHASLRARSSLTARFHQLGNTLPTEFLPALSTLSNKAADVDKNPSGQFRKARSKRLAPMCLAYPANSSSGPSPDRLTVTNCRASFATR